MPDFFGIRFPGLLAVALALCLVQCSSLTSKSSAAEMIGLTKADAGRTVELKVGQVVRIELPGNPSTGFSWRFTVINMEYLERLEEKTRELSSTKRKGAPVLFIWRLRALKAGRTRIELAYFRPWEGADKSAERFSLNLHIRP